MIPSQRARLGAYLYAACRARSEGRAYVGSDELARVSGFIPSQVRRDLAEVLGKLGKRGSGYDPADLTAGLARVLDGDATGAAALLIAAAARGRVVLAQNGDPLADLVAILATTARSLELRILDEARA